MGMQPGAGGDPGQNGARRNGARPRAAGAHGAAAAASPTLEGIWRRYGARLERFVAGRVGDDPGAVSAACHATMVRAAYDLSTLPTPRRSADLWPWLRGHAEQAGGRPAPLAAEHYAGPLPGSLPGWLRLHFQLRAIKETLDHEADRLPAGTPIAGAIQRQRRRLREEYERWAGVPVLVLVGRSLRRASDRVEELARASYRRVESSVSGAGSSSHNLSGFLAGAPGLTEAAAAVTAMVAFGLGVPAAAAPAPAPQASTPPSYAPAARPALAFIPPVSATASPGPRPEIVTEPERELELEPARIVSPAPKPVSPAPTLTSAAPRVTRVEPSPDRDRPLNEKQHEEGATFTTPEHRVAVDVDNDGEEDASVATPYVWIECGRPEDRGPVTEATCPTIEEAI